MARLGFVGEGTAGGFVPGRKEGRKVIRGWKEGSKIVGGRGGRRKGSYRRRKAHL